MSPRRSVLGTTGRPEHVQLEAAVQRSLDDIHGDMRGLVATDIAFTAAPADWVAPVPTTVAEALRRLAAAAGAHPVP